MRVLLTGGTGNVGKAAVAHLYELGHEVTVIGRSAQSGVENASYVQCDISDYDRLEEVMRGHEAVVHLAAHPSPVGLPGREVFRVNDLGTFNVFEAAAECGISRVVGASSINAVGYFFGDRSVPLSYLPVDEKHPTLATDAYSFSKQVMESIGTYFWERDRIASVMLRLPSVMPHERIRGNADHYRRYDLEVIRRLLALPDSERRAEVDRMQTGFDRYRRTHRADEISRSKWWAEPDEASGLSRDEFFFMHHKVNFFTYVDELDSAQAIAKGLSAEYEGSEALFINAKRNSLGLPVTEMARLYGLDESAVRSTHEGDDTIVSIDRARELIGYEPQWEMATPQIVPA